MTGKCTCYAMVSEDDPRYEIWVQVDPDARMPIKHSVPHRDASGHSFYEGDLSRLVDEQKATMYELLAAKFGATPEDIRRNFEAMGYIPIRTPVTLAICPLHTRCMM